MLPTFRHALGMALFAAAACAGAAVQIKTHAGFCLDASTPSAIVQQACDASKAAQVFDNTSTAGRFAQGGNCLGAPANSDGTQLSMMACSNAATAWTTPSGTLKHSASAKCADIPGYLAGVAGTKAQLWSCDSSNEQQFTLPVVSSGDVFATFTGSTEDFLNPERGFYVTLADDEMVADQILQFVDVWHTRLFHYHIDLSPYRDSPLPASYIQALNQRFAEGRKAKVKFEVLPSYNLDESGADAPIDLVLQHIRQLKPVFTKNADVIPFMRAGFIGAWGEWHTSQNHLDTDENKLRIKNALMANTPPSLIVHYRKPSDIANWYPGDPAGAAAARIGFHNDCYMADDTDVGTFSGLDDPLREYARALTQSSGFGGETCYDLEHPEQRRLGCPAALSEHAAYHLTWLSASYAEVFLDNWKQGGCWDEISRTMGYRLQLDSVSHPASAAKGSTVAVRVNLRNIGWSRLFSHRPLVVTLRHQTTAALIVGSADDLSRFASGASGEVVVNVTIPSDAAAGRYAVQLGAPDIWATTKGAEYAIRFANADLGGQIWNAGSGRFSTGTKIDLQ